MGNLTQVTIDFERSHLLFPTLIGIVLCLLGAAIVITRRDRLARAPRQARAVFAAMDRPRFLGTLALTVLYFSLMVPVGGRWPNTGLGFLLCSVPYLLATGILFMHDRRPRAILAMAAIALAAPVLVWWLFTEIFYLTLP